MNISTCNAPALILVNKLRGGGSFWKNKNNGEQGYEDDYEYYEEYYDEYDEPDNGNDNSAAGANNDYDYLDAYSEYYNYEEEDSRDTKRNTSKNSLDQDEEEDADYHNYVIDTPTKNKGNGNNQRKNGNKLFNFGGSANSSNSRNRRSAERKENKQISKNRFMSSTTRASRTSFVPSFRAPSLPHYSVRGVGQSLSGATSAVAAILSSSASILAKYLSTLSTFIVSSLQPVYSFLYSMACYAYSTLSHWIILGIQLLRDVIDIIWYGPALDGITTTGVMSRYGGLRGILFGSSLSTTITAVVGVGIISWIVTAGFKSLTNDEIQRDRSVSFRPWTWLRFGRRSHIIDDDEEEDDVDANPHFSLEPPTVDEELEFINRTFKSTNPTSKQRISESIAMSNQGLLHRLTNRRSGENQPGKKSPRRQRKMTIKSIQKWWKRDPNTVNGGQPINIIKPNNRSYFSKSKNPSINQLQNQLHKSEVERYQLQNDIQKLQLRLQKAHSDARSIASQNKWLEKQTSRADQILNRAVEVERKKANEEVERVRGEMKGVLERERLMIRGNSRSSKVGGRRMVGGGNDIDLNHGPNMRVMDGVKIVRDVDDYDDDDMLDERGRPPWRAM